MEVPHSGKHDPLTEDLLDIDSRVVVRLDHFFPKRLRKKPKIAPRQPTGLAAAACSAGFSAAGWAAGSVGGIGFVVLLI
jgi:hypothetical protein